MGKYTIGVDQIYCRNDKSNIINQEWTLQLNSQVKSQISRDSKTPLVNEMLEKIVEKLSWMKWRCGNERRPRGTLYNKPQKSDGPEILYQLISWGHENMQWSRDVQRQNGHPQRQVRRRLQHLDDRDNVSLTKVFITFKWNARMMPLTKGKLCCPCYTLRNRR